MANLFQNLFGPVAPGLSPTINPISMLGAGMYSGNPVAALAQMGQMQQAGQQLAFNQQMQQQKMAMLREEQAREQQKQEALSKAAFASLNPFLGPLAPDVADQWRKTLEPLAAAGGAPGTVLGITTSGLTPPEPTSMQQNIEWAMGLPEGDPRREAVMASYTKPETSITLGEPYTPTEAKQAAVAETTIDQLTELDDLLSGRVAGQDEPVDLSGLEGKWKEWRAGTGVGPGLAREILGPMDNYDARAVSLAKQVQIAAGEALVSGVLTDTDMARVETALGLIGGPDTGRATRELLKVLSKQEYRKGELRGRKPNQGITVISSRKVD